MLMNTSISDEAPSPAALAWYGNAAKMRVIGLITQRRGPFTVIDYGSGEGQGWSYVLSDYPEIDLVCIEPDPARAVQLRRNVPSARNYDHDPSHLSESADVVVSFSVFEHVHDRKAYLSNAFRWLKPGGTFYLNYDDGHFREPGSRIEALRNLTARFLPALGLTQHYQARVIRSEADDLIAEAGFTILSSRYENLRSFKRLAKTIPPEQRAVFARFWLETEERLNAEFAGDGPEHLGDRANLWREMATRTLELVYPQ